ncbi:hypothetical protein BAOM_3038 [Peribacillus asahii]|uniref:Uncharacterized protein n=1 Tax=Peribacillus asahii TaxID=228899 RepID=A0A3Q9RP50_9BACI|nr:hypothetical protein [Peribacillus asahii]AZV43647.1 hypothetical protein BAOM_3038 [Peribacillus asahii]
MSKKEIDVLLDTYNDYVKMYAIFGDVEYKYLANSVLEKLRKGVNHVPY